jgi:hypothetical protein
MVATCAHLLVAPKWTVVDVEINVGMELDATVQRSDLGCAWCEFRREAQGATKRSVRRKRHGGRLVHPV